jgi:site-specific DNA recombinase
MPAQRKLETSTLRVLGRLRLSRSTEESTSIERQREIIEQWAGMSGHTVVGWASDVDVSGSTDPFETAQLGDWLNNRAPEFDVIACWKLDRLGRNAILLNKLFGWCLEHDKTIFSCSESIDLSTPVGRLIAHVIGFLAEGELEAIRERQRSSKAKLRELGRWAGGKPPYGYRGARNPDGAGWRLEIDPEAARVVERIVQDVIDGKPLARIARELTSEGYRPPAAYYTALRRASEGPVSALWQAGESPTGKWHMTPIRNMLRSKALRGYAHHNGQTVRDDEGDPVQIAAPLITPDDWELLQAALDRKREGFSGALRNEASPLSGVVVCYICGSPLHHDRNAFTRNGHDYLYRYYRCRDRDNEAHKGSAMIPADMLEELAEESFLGQYGDTEVRQRVWVRGDTHETELRQAVADFDELVGLIGTSTSDAGKQRLQRQIAAKDARIAELEQTPTREARWEWKATGGTYGDAWRAAGTDPDARRELLHKSGITIAACIRGVAGKRYSGNGGSWHMEIRVPDGEVQFTPAE